MKNIIYFLLIVCALVFTASCGDSGDPLFVTGDAASAGNVPFAVEEQSKVGVSEITEETFAAPEYELSDGAVRAYGEEISAAGVDKGELVENGKTYVFTDAELFDSPSAAGISSSAITTYIDSDFLDENGNVRDGVRFLLVDLEIRNNALPSEMGISDLELNYCEQRGENLSVRAFYPLPYPVYFSNAGAGDAYYHYTLPVGETMSARVGWYVDLTKYDKSSLFLIFNSRIDDLRQYLPLFPSGGN
jgi:hypothetical protein